MSHFLTCLADFFSCHFNKSVLKSIKYLAFAACSVVPFGCNERALANSPQLQSAPVPPEQQGWMGAALEDLSIEKAKPLGIDGPAVRIIKVVTGSPAEKGGVKTGDVILEINGTAVKSSQEVIALVSSKRPGSPVGLKLKRDKVQLELNFSLGARSDLKMETPEVLLGKSAPALTFQALADGKSRALADSKGKVVLVEFWATWCPACRAAIPGLNKLSKKHDLKNLEIIAVSDEESALVKSFQEKHKMTYTVGILSDKISPFPVVALPSFFLIDGTGTVKAVAQGEDELEKLIPVLEKLVANSKGK